MSMSDPIFDLDSWEPLFPIGNGMAVDRNGRFSLRLDEHSALDTETGKVRFTTAWETPEEDPGDDF